MGDNEDRSGCYLSLWAPLETWPMAPAVLVSLTSACDIITRCPDINPDTACSDKKTSKHREAIPHGQSSGKHGHCSASLGVFTEI